MTASGAPALSFTICMPTKLAPGGSIITALAGGGVGAVSTAPSVAGAPPLPVAPPVPGLGTSPVESASRSCGVGAASVSVPLTPPVPLPGGRLRPPLPAVAGSGGGGGDEPPPQSITTTNKIREKAALTAYALDMHSPPCRPQRRRGFSRRLQLRQTFLLRLIAHFRYRNERT